MGFTLGLCQRCLQTMTDTGELLLVMASTGASTSSGGIRAVARQAAPNPPTLFAAAAGRPSSCPVGVHVICPVIPHNLYGQVVVVALVGPNPKDQAATLNFPADFIGGLVLQD